MDGLIRSFLESECFEQETVRQCVAALEKQGAVRLAHLKYLTFEDLIDAGIPKLIAKVFDQEGFLQTCFSMQPSTSSRLHSLKRNTSLQYEMESQQGKVKRQRTAKKYLSSKQMSLANISGALPTEYVYGWDNTHDLHTFMDTQRLKLEDWKQNHGANNLPADGLIIFVLRHIYNLHFELPLSRASAQTVLNSQAGGISSYAFTHLHFGFNIGLPHLEKLNYTSGNILLKSLAKAYARLAATNKNVGPTVLTIERVTAQVAPDIAAEVYGDMSTIYPQFELEGDEAFPQSSIEDNEANPVEVVAGSQVSTISQVINI